MFREMRASALADLVRLGDVNITIKQGWDAGVSWQSTPAYINYWIGYESERIFKCYLTSDGDSLQVAHIEPTSLIKDVAKLVDAYLYAAVKGLIDECHRRGKRRLVVDSYIPSVVDHMVDLGFNVNSKGFQPGGYGCKILKD